MCVNLTLRAKCLPMITTGTVGGCSCGSVVSSRRGMAKACARAGTMEEYEESYRVLFSRLFDIELKADD